MASSYVSLNVHVIFATKNREPIIAKTWRDDLHTYLGGTIRGLGTNPLAVGGVVDHVHLFFGFKATHFVADIVREVKKASSVWSSQRFAAFAWQTGYAAFSVGSEQMESVRAYIINQERHHANVSSENE